MYRQAARRLSRGISTGRLLQGDTVPPSERYFAGRASARLTPERAHVFFQSIETLLEDFEKQSTAPALGDWYDLTAAMYPVKQ